MTYITSWEEFAKAAERLYIADPMKVRFTMKYRNCDEKVVVKVTDDQVANSMADEPTPVCVDRSVSYPSFRLISGDHALVLNSKKTIGAHVSKNSFKKFVQSLWDADNDRVHVKCQFQSAAIFQEDTSELPLFLSIDQTFLKRPTYKYFQTLLNNYIRDPTKTESRTVSEKNEETVFLKAVVNTPVMKLAYNYLKNNKFINMSMAQFQTYLQQIWFGLYNRKHGSTTSSCGFEHVFVGEYKNNAVNGLHNWVQFYLEEKQKRINYEGYIKYRFLSTGTSILTNAFLWNGHSKVKGGMFIGTSPEFELALYTACFIIHPNSACSFVIDGVYIKVITYQLNYRGIEYVATSFPVIG
ncbi:Poly(U)-specific endoribonuclease-B [Nymphon striatum]|nr:Poly(U)-specific endoribonuclease-B [Nymphon striatum]